MTSFRNPNKKYNVPRGVYSGKSDYLVLLKNYSFYEKPAKNVMWLD